MKKDKDIEENIEEAENEASNEETKVDGKPDKKVPRKELEKAYKEIAKLNEQLEKANADRDNWKNEYYKAYADTQNLRKSLEQDSRNAVRYRAMGFLENLLPALNAFHLALDNPAPTPEARNYQIGFSYIYSQLVAALESEGVSEISPKIGDKFDLDSMHAVDTDPRDDMEEGLVTKVLSKGYRLHDRLVSAAMVRVSAKPKKEEKENNEEAEADKKPAEA
ncbi:MAG: nucleotide exchange factor GrpE [Bacilli bacterium]|nr:nucleotide exchange factor GrpE [Bacilli bacterium]